MTSCCEEFEVNVLGSKYVNTSAGQIGRLVPKAITAQGPVSKKSSFLCKAALLLSVEADAQEDARKSE
jgi:hypothetical protein